MKKICIFLFLISCAPQKFDDNFKVSPLDFNNDLTFDEFKKLLIEYTKITPYPDIDE